MRHGYFAAFRGRLRSALLAGAVAASALSLSGAASAEEPGVGSHCDRLRILIAIPDCPDAVRRACEEIEEGLHMGSPQSSISSRAMDLCAVSDSCLSVRHHMATVTDMYGAPYDPLTCY
jgi:hypothetical protein